ncbi:MAG: hypothetical protein II984_08575 [Clostridia bacterium]|nr:hypothetical protein [Clostridia bacterium]
MENLKNNKIYKFGQLALLSISVTSILLMLIRLIAPAFSQKMQFISAYAVWRFFDVGLSAYQSEPSTETIFRLIISCGILFGIFVACLIFSNKWLGAMIGALSYFILDTCLFTYEIAIQNWTKMLVVGLIYKIILITIMIIAVIYGFIGMRIEGSGRSKPPNIKFSKETFSHELALQKRIITLERNKSFLNSHIYFQIVLDNKTVGYMKNGEKIEIEMDANEHTVMIISHFANIKAIKRSIPIGTESNSYTIKIEKKNLFVKKIAIYRNNA